MNVRYEQEEKIFRSAGKPFYVCHGEYEFLQKEMAEKIVNHLLPRGERDFGLQKFDGSEESALAGVINAAAAPSLFSPKQVLLIDNAQDFTLKKNEATEGKSNIPPEEKYENYGLYGHFVRMLERPRSEVHLVMICHDELKAPAGKTGVSRSEKMLVRNYSLLDKNGVLIHFPRMYDRDLAAWIADRARRVGLRLAAEQSEELLEWAGKDVRHLANEIEKMAVFAGDEKQLSMEDMRRLVTSSEDVFVNLLIDYMLAGRGKAALRMLDRSFKGGDNPVFIINTIASRLRSLWQARYLIEKGYFRRLPEEYGFAAKGKISEAVREVAEADRSVLSAEKKSSILGKTEFAIYHLLKPARRFTLPRIETAISAALDVDRRLKGIARPKHGSDEIMIQNYIVDIAREVKSAGVPN